MGCGDSKIDAQAARCQSGSFQVKLNNGWKDYDKDEDVMITRAFLLGQQFCCFSLHSEARYEVDFKKMIQINLDTGKVRTIRPPPGMHAPKTPLLPAGPMIVLSVKAGQPGKVIKVYNPSNPGQQVKVAVPKTAKVGSDLAVPLPAKGETATDVVRRQEGMGLGAKLELGTTSAVVGGVVLGDHLTGCELVTKDIAAHAGDSIAHCSV